MNSALRRRRIRRLLAEEVVSSQAELVRLLEREDFDVTQATVSRDLQALGAVKSRQSGRLRYILPDETIPAGEAYEAVARSLSAFAESILPSGNLVVIRTSPGAAHVVAASIDAAPLRGVMGTIAGDDTLVVVASESVGGRRVAKQLEQIGAG